MAGFDALLAPLTIKGLTIRNRVLSTAHACGYGEDGHPRERYQLYHEEKAKGGVGLTIFGGSSSVAVDSPGPMRQLYLGDDSILPHFERFAARIHGHGGAVMCQITHIGRKIGWDEGDWLWPISPGTTHEPQHRTSPKVMEDFDIRRVVRAFGAAARRTKEGGLDGVELIAAGQHLLDQFLSPSANDRTDKYGGSVANRTRFCLEVLEEVRAQVGDDYVVGWKMSGDEMMEGGSTPEECLEVAHIIADSGLVDFLDIVAGTVNNLIRRARHIPGMWSPVAPYLYLASAIKAACDVPVFHGSRIPDLASAARAVQEGHVDMVGMTRAHMADPHLVRKLAEGRLEDIRQCVGAAYCNDRSSTGRDVVCIQNAATGREGTLPHVIPKATGDRRRVVVVGAGPGGLEAARVAAERGHEVVLFEAQDRVGGQINLAALATWREALSGIVRWLESQISKLDVDVRLGTEADMAAVLAEDPDVVVVATGGRPNPGHVEGGEHLVRTWDILRGDVAPADSVLLYDDHGDHQAPSCAEVLARRGSRVELVTPDRAPLQAIGHNNFQIHMREMHANQVVFTPDTRLTQVYPEGNRLVAVLRNEYTEADEERVVDQVVAEFGTRPREELYLALRPGSINLGEIDVDALAAGRAQDVATNPTGRYRLYRIGDALSGRNIHAAILDALRLAKDF